MSMQLSPAAPMGLEDNVYNRLLRERIIFLGTEVKDENANAICAQLLLLAAEDPSKDIHLYINSPGGSVSAGMAIYDTMQYVKPDVVTVAMGLAASMGQFLLTAGAKGKRYATPHARIMMHQPSGGMGGSASDIRIQAEQMLHTKRQMARAERPAHRVEPWRRSTERLRPRPVVHRGGGVGVRLRRPRRPECVPGLRGRRHGLAPHRRQTPPDRASRDPSERPAGPDDELLHPAVGGAHLLRIPAYRPLREAVRGADHLPRHADFR